MKSRKIPSIHSIPFKLYKNTSSLEDIYHLLFLIELFLETLINFGHQNSHLSASSLINLLNSCITKNRVKNNLK